ncbi:MAG: hypothetical protein WD851_18400 [Pirellulales bacterium]
MHCRIHLPLFVMMLLPCTEIAAAAGANLADNAALQYWKAFAFLPTLDADQEKLIAEWQTAPLDAKVDDLLSASQNSLMFLHRGAKMKNCDWGLDDQDGISTLLPHLAKARTLALIAALDARRAFERDNAKAAREDAVSIMALARHVGRDPIMICFLVRYNLEGLVVDLVAPHVPDLKMPYSEAVAMLEAMPRAATLQESVLHEKKIMAPSMIKQLTDAEERHSGGWRDLWMKLLDGANAPEQVRNIESLPEVIRLINGFFSHYDELATIVALPKHEFDTQYAAFEQRIKAANPMTAVLLPTMDELLAKEHRNTTRMQLLLAAIAVASDGPGALAKIDDPFGDGPFEYRKLDDGFELKSQLESDGEPVTLTVGQEP